MKISCSAPAKVILSGEHAVVYGKPALVSAIDIRLTCTAETAAQDPSDPHLKAILEIVKAYLNKEHIGYKSAPVRLGISSNIPRGRGLGSSAALSVAATAALLVFYTGKEQSRETVNNLAYKVEKHFHKNPSGVDNSTSCMGGLIFYRKEFEFLKYISSLQFKIPKRIEDSLYLIDSGKPKENTAEMVDMVGKRYNQNPKKMEKVFQQMEKTTKRMVVALMKEDSQFFRSCVEENQLFLEEIGVVSPKAKQILKSLEGFGSGKITGAGGKKAGGGYILFSAIDSERFENHLKNKNINYLKFKQDYDGYKLA